MVRLNLLAVCLIFAFAIHYMECSVGLFNSNIEINAVQNLTQFLNENSGIQVEPLTRTKTFDEISQTFQIVHKFGERIGGKRIVSFKFINFALNCIEAMIILYSSYTIR